MFRLKTLVCCGCELLGDRKSFLDYENKTPLFTKCGHPLCSECGKKYSECPICKKAIEPIENFAARGLFETIKEDPLTVFQNWFNAEIGGPEPCSKCFDCKKRLFLCIECELELDHLGIEYVPNDGEPWEDYGQKEEAKRRQEMKMKNCFYPSNFLPSPRLRDEKMWRPRFRFDFITLANSVLCVDCVVDLDHQHKKKPIDVWKMECTVETLKRSSAWVATRFISSQLKSRSGKCLIRAMRMHRICEKLVHLALIYYPDPDKPILACDYHDLWPSTLNKFFQSFGRKYLEKIPMNHADIWVQSLRNQLRSLENQDKCDCEEVWKEMHGLSFGNQIEKKFVEIIDRLENNDIYECPFRVEEVIKTRNKAVELSETNLFKVYTAFCWNYKQKRVCCMFDDDERQPCVCLNCGVSTCMFCLKSNPLYKCSSCGNSFFEDQVIQNVITPREYKMDKNLLALVIFYKKNCVKMLEEWWNCDASQLQFCLSCSSYSDQLEVCAYCEFTSKTKALKTKPQIEHSVQLRQHMPLYFNYSGIEMFPIRWQCPDCVKRLQAEWMHKYCGDSKCKEWKGTWNRGCNHLLTRVYNTKKCSGYDVCGDKCEYNAINLKDIANYEMAMKAATSKLVLTILKAGITEQVNDHRRKTDMLKLYGTIRTQTRYYFKNTMNGKLFEDISAGITELIGELKEKWNKHLVEDEDCSLAREVSDKCTLRLDLKEFDILDEDLVFPWV